MKTALLPVKGCVNIRGYYVMSIWNFLEGRDERERKRDT